MTRSTPYEVPAFGSVDEARQHPTVRLEAAAHAHSVSGNALSWRSFPPLFEQLVRAEPELAR